MTLASRLTWFDGLRGDRVTQELRKYLIEEGFFTAPASTKYHGAYEGGLFEHSLEVTKILTGLTYRNKLKWDSPESPFIVGMFHDLCKIDQYIYEKDGTYSFNSETKLKGHGIKSVMMLSQFIRLTDEEKLCIEHHMGAFTDKSEWIDYTTAVSRCPNVLWTHIADMAATHISKK